MLLRPVSERHLEKTFVAAALSIGLAPIKTPGPILLSPAILASHGAAIAPARRRVEAVGSALALLSGIAASALVLGVVPSASFAPKLPVVVGAVAVPPFTFLAVSAVVFAADAALDILGVRFLLQHSPLQRQAPLLFSREQ